MFKLSSNLPFYWRLTDSEKFDEGEIPTNLPFELEIENGLVRVRRNVELINALEKVYSLDYNIGYIQEGYDIAAPYIEDFTNFIYKYLNHFSGSEKILEIGCGGGLILKQFHDKGYICLGIDPSPIAAKASKKYGFPLISETFPVNSLKNRFDFIYHSDVLEHVLDPISFIKEQYDILNKDGILIVSIPNATENLELGDISIAMHQHLQYFTFNSITNLLHTTGFKVIGIEKSGYGGSIYCAAVKTESDDFYNAENKIEKELPNFENAINNFRTNLETTKGSIGFYVPLRALPYLSAVKYNLMDPTFRFFDDTSHWHKKHFDGTLIKIENFKDLVDDPVDNIFIMSLTFEHEIKQKIQNYFKNKIKVTSLRDLISKMNN